MQVERHPAEVAVRRLVDEPVYRWELLSTPLPEAVRWWIRLARGRVGQPLGPAAPRTWLAGRVQLRLRYVEGRNVDYPLGRRLVQRWSGWAEFVLDWRRSTALSAELFEKTRLGTFAQLLRAWPGGLYWRPYQGEVEVHLGVPQGCRSITAAVQWFHAALARVGEGMPVVNALQSTQGQPAQGLAPSATAIRRGATGRVVSEADRVRIVLAGLRCRTPLFEPLTWLRRPGEPPPSWAGLPLLLSESGWSIRWAGGSWMNAAPVVHDTDGRTWLAAGAMTTGYNWRRLRPGLEVETARYQWLALADAPNPWMVWDLVAAWPAGQVAWLADPHDVAAPEQRLRAAALGLRLGEADPATVRLVARQGLGMLARGLPVSAVREWIAGLGALELQALAALDALAAFDTATVS